MARFSPTQGPVLYDQGGESTLGRYLDYARTKQYYDYANKDLAFRQEQADVANSLARAELLRSNPDLRYYPNPPVAEKRSYRDPVLSKPSFGGQGMTTGVPHIIPPEYGGSVNIKASRSPLTGALMQETAEPGKPIALAGELTDGGFAPSNIYREAPTRNVQVEDPRYQRMADTDFYRDLNYYPEQEAMWEEKGYQPGAAARMARDPSAAYGMSDLEKFGPRSERERLSDILRTEGIRSGIAFNDWKAKYDYELAHPKPTTPRAGSAPDTPEEILRSAINSLMVRYGGFDKIPQREWDALGITQEQAAGVLTGGWDPGTPMTGAATPMGEFPWTPMDPQTEEMLRRMRESQPTAPQTGRTRR